MPENLQVVAVLIIVFGLPAAITWSKGQRLLFAAGFLFPGPVWIVAAFRLGHPSSRWARRFYGPAKMRRARERFDHETA